MTSPRADRRNARHPGRNAYPPRAPGERRPDSLFVYGIHPVLAALANPRRTVRRILATANALARLTAAGAILPLAPEETTPRHLDRLLGGEAVHQGVAVEVAPLEPLAIESLGEADLVVVLDQVTDPHNVGAIMRSAIAFGADAIITTGRHTPAETGVLAKAASGALDQLAHVEVQNLARALATLAELGFTRIGLDSEAGEAIDQAMTGARVALVLGAEGKGLRRLTRDTCDRLARLPTVGPIASLNVSNAAVLALYMARRHLDTAKSWSTCGARGADAP
ncbi:MAG: RNA methyltransferase [Bauldia sp.]|nr:MAG: RNA methyltransferase [Bauldia sp.]